MAAPEVPKIHSASHSWYSLKPEDLGHLLPQQAIVPAGGGAHFSIIDPNNREAVASARCWEIAKIALEVIVFVAAAAGIVTVAAIFLGTTIYIAPITITLMIIGAIFFDRVLKSQVQACKTHCRENTLLTQVQEKLTANDGTLNNVDSLALLNAQLATRVREGQLDATMRRWGENLDYARFKELAITYDILHEEQVAVERKFNIALVELEMLRAVEQPSAYIQTLIQQKEAEVAQLGFVQYPRLKLHVALAQARLEHPEFQGSFAQLGQLQTQAVWTVRPLEASLPFNLPALIPHFPAARLANQVFSERNLGPALAPNAEGVEPRGQQFDALAIQAAVDRINAARDQDQSLYHTYAQGRTTDADLTAWMVDAMLPPADAEN